jgi:DNA-binding GntR family transcriptional regulator
MVARSRSEIATHRAEYRDDEAGSSKLADRAYGQLEELIVTLKLAPGSTWSEATLCEKIGIGRTPVREALQRLALEQLVEIVPRFGVIVTEILVPEQIMVVEMRRALDPVVATRAARRSSPREKARIAEFRQRLILAGRAGDAEEFLRLHYSMRRFLSNCTRNKFLAASMASIDALSRRFFFVHQTKREHLERAIALHSDVLQAIVMEDEPAALAAANRLVDHVEEFTRAAFDSHY